MKKEFFIVIVLFLNSLVYGENSLNISFRGNGADLETVLIKNKTKGTFKEINASNILQLGFVDKIDLIKSDEESFTIFPNPVFESTNIRFINPDTGNVLIEIVNINGKSVLTYYKFLESGAFNFKLSGIESGIYFINIKTSKRSLTGKIISANKNKSQIILENNFPEISNNTNPVSKISNNKRISSDTIEMDYSIYDRLEFIGKVTGFKSDTIFTSPVMSDVFTFNFSISIPTLSTASIKNLALTSVSSGGNISNDGGSPVIERGICYSTTPNPTINDLKVTNGIGTGSFSCKLNELNPNTIYYLKAYCTNKVGTAYGNQVSFNTSSSAIGSKGFPQPSDALFYSDYFDFSTNKWKDKSGNSNDADLIKSNCGTVKKTTVMKFTKNLEGNIQDWNLTYSGKAIPKLNAGNISFSEAGTIFNIRLTNPKLNIEHYYPCSEGTLTVYDCSGNSNHITVTGSNNAEWSANKQDSLHYNLKKGGSLSLSSDLISNPLFNGSFSNGLAPGWIDYNSLSKSDEKTIIRNTTSQRFKANTGAGIRTIADITKIKTGCILGFSAWVYVVSGKAKANIYGYESTSSPISDIQSSLTGVWEKIETKVMVYNTPIYNIYTSIFGAMEGSEIIVGEVQLSVVSNEIIIPALENANFDALGRELEVVPFNISKVETSIAFHYNDELINSDRNNFLFNEFKQPKEIKLRNIPFANVNLAYQNTLFCNQKLNQFFIFKNEVGDAGNLRSLLNNWNEDPFRVYKNPYEMSLNYSDYIKVRDINRNFRVGTKKTGTQLVVSTDYGVTWGNPLNYDSNNGVHRIYITSKGTVIIFCKNSIIKRLPLGSTVFDEIHPVDPNGEVIKIHTPVNVNFPGEYFRPYNRILDLYDDTDNSNLIVWGNWGNNDDANGASPTNIFYSNDDCATIKSFYQFGQNPNYTDTGGKPGKNGKLLGNPDNPVICRHVHEVSYNKFNKKFYITCGDSHVNPELHIFETTYNKSNDTWEPLKDLVSNEARCQRHRAIGLGFDENGYLYFGSDADPQVIKFNGLNYNSQGVYKVHINDINNISKYKLLHQTDDIVTNSYMNDNYILFSCYENQKNILHISTDKGNTWSEIDMSEFETNWYPYDNVPVSNIQLIKEDNQKNIFLKTISGAYINLAK